MNLNTGFILYWNLCGDL